MKVTVKFKSVPAEYLIRRCGVKAVTKYEASVGLPRDIDFGQCLSTVYD